MYLSRRMDKEALIFLTEVALASLQYSGLPRRSFLKEEAADLLRLSLRSYTLSFAPLSDGKEKSQGELRIKERGRVYLSKREGQRIRSCP